VPSLHLLVLLLSAQKQVSEALALAEMILEEYPDNVNVMYVLAHLELHTLGGQVRTPRALSFAKWDEARRICATRRLEVSLCGGMKYWAAHIMYCHINLMGILIDAILKVSFWRILSL